MHSNRPPGQPSAEQGRRVSHLNEMPGDRWMMARFAFGAFRTDRLSSLIRSATYKSRRNFSYCRITKNGQP